MRSLALVVTATAIATPAGAQLNGVGDKPYMGWSSFSQQTISTGFLTQSNIQAQSDALKASGLQEHGFTYINMDSGWQGGFDGNGRPIPDTTKFPDIKALVAHIHANGQKAGIYWIPGIELPAIQGNYPILGTSYFTPDIVVTPHAKGNAFAGNPANGDPYHDKIDFTKPGAQEYINSIVALWAGWGIDSIKLDGVTPGSDSNNTSIDNRADVAAYSKAIVASGRPMWLTLSWALNQDYLSTWQQYSNARRIDEDVECEGRCGPYLTNWPRIILRAYDDVAWEHAASAAVGWNDLDTLDVGDGTLDGLTNDEKISAIDLWLMANAPLYLGGDLTRLDSFAKSAFSNDELLAVDQTGHPAVQITGGFHQVWVSDPGTGSVYVALYNFTAFPDRVDVRWSDLGFGNATAVRDLWSRTDLGAFPSTFSAMLPAHGSRLLEVTPDSSLVPVTGGTAYEAEAAQLAGSASVASCTACSGGQKVQNIGKANTVTFNNVTVPAAGIYRMEINAMTQGPRTLEYSVNGAPAGSLNMGGGSYALPQSSTVNIALNVGANTIAFSNPSGYGADLDRILIRGDGKEPANTFTTYEGEGAKQAGTAVGAFNYSTRASGGAYIGGMGNGAANTVTFDNVSVPSTGTYQLELDYVVNGTRTFYVSVNGGTPTVLNLTGNSWYDPIPYTMSVQLNGGSPNSIVFSNPNAGAYAPGLDLIAVSGAGNTAPILSVPSGSYTTVQNVSITDTTAGATIFYTTDGSTPSSSSTKYTGPISVISTETIKAIAIAPGYPDSNIAAATYSISLATVPPPSITLALSASTLVIPRGKSSTVTLSVTPQFGFSGQVSFACSGLPSGVSCAFDPSTVTPSGTNATTSTLTVNAANHVSLSGIALLPAAGLAAMLCLFGMRRRHALATLAVLALGTIGLTMITGCGGSSQPPLTTTVIVTATSGNVSQSTPLLITVQ